MPIDFRGPNKTHYNNMGCVALKPNKADNVSYSMLTAKEKDKLSLIMSHRMFTFLIKNDAKGVGVTVVHKMFEENDPRYLNPIGWGSLISSLICSYALPDAKLYMKSTDEYSWQRYAAIINAVCMHPLCKITNERINSLFTTTSGSLIGEKLKGGLRHIYNENKIQDYKSLATCRTSVSSRLKLFITTLDTTNAKSKDSVEGSSKENE